MAQAERMTQRAMWGRMVVGISNAQALARGGRELEALRELMRVSELEFELVGDLAATEQAVADHLAMWGLSPCEQEAFFNAWDDVATLPKHDWTPNTFADLVCSQCGELSKPSNYHFPCSGGAKP